MYKDIIKQNLMSYLLIILSSLIFILGCSLLENKLRPKTENIVIEHNKIFVSKNFFINLNKVKEKDLFFNFNYNAYIKSYPFLNKFYNKTKDVFEYNKFCLNWDQLNKEQQLQWFQNHIYINNFNICVFEYMFILNEADIKDFNYSKQNLQRFLDNFILTLQEDIIKINENIKFINIDSICLDTINTKQINKHKIYKFNLINNCLFGLLFGFIICSIDLLRRKQKILKK